MRALWWVFVLSVSLSAQVVTPTAPVTADVMVVAATGDALTLVPIASRTTVLNGTTCNLPASPAGPTPLINPTAAEVTDPFTAGRVCRLAMPVNLPNGTYRAVAVFNATCTGLPCTSPRTVGVPPFDIVGTQAPPAAPTNVVVRP